jgi:predicted O-linked N-acetylglucosamine transferase (SPINDLY family)
MSSLIFSKRNLCDWEEIDDQEIQLITHLNQKEFSPFIPFMLCACSPITANNLYQAAKTYSDFTYPMKVPITKVHLIASRHPKLRIGYLSADFHSHATVYLMAGILENRNKAKFDVYLYSYGIDKKDEVRSRIENACEIFRNVRELSDEQIAKNILVDEIDILIDLKGYTGGTRLGITALRPAPIIINWLGYPGTLGHECLADYIIGDATVTPINHAQHFSETLALLPHCYQPNDNKRPIGVAPTRTEVGLPENAMVFCTFNQAYKITPEMFDI